jgi:hypothetical protein
MKTNGETRFPYFLVGLALGAIGGLMSAILARKETREKLLEQSSKSLDYLDEQAKKIRAGTEGIIAKGKELIGQRRCSSQVTTGNGTQAPEEAKLDH